MTIFGSRQVRTINPLGTRQAGAGKGEWRERTYPAEDNTDWLGLRHAPNPVVNALSPFHGEEVYTSTPMFLWPDLGATHTYQIKVYQGATLIRTLTSEPGMNFLLVPIAQALPLDNTLSWTVRSTTAATGVAGNLESSKRYFYVRPESTPYTLDYPGVGATLGDRIYDKLLGLNGQTAVAHPRCLTKDPTTLANMVTSFSPDDPRYSLVKYVEQTMSDWETKDVPQELTFLANGTLGEVVQITLVLHMYWKLGEMAGWPASKTQRARDIIRRHMTPLFTYWDGSVGMKRGFGTVNGVDQTNARTDYNIQDQDCRYYLLALGLAYDIFKPGNGTGVDLTAAELTRLLDIAQHRIGQIYDNFYTSRRLQQFQYESHGIGNVGYVAFASLMFLEADMSSYPTTYGMATKVPQIVKVLLPQWLHFVQSFKTDDGSSHSGGAYDDFDTISSPLVQMTIHILDINLMDKPKYYNTPLWKIYMNGIPGARTRSQFGDGSMHHTPYPGAYGAMVYRYPSPLTAFKYPSIPGESIVLHQIGFTPLRGKIPPAAPPAVLSRVFPTGGYYCSLANFTDKNATAVYMRCSQHGGYNHAHHDANGIVVWGNNEQLLIDSGYYDIVGYGVPHWLHWNRSSRAHNTLSMDNGAGQQNNGGGDTDLALNTNGRLIYWKDDGDYSCTIGDATRSYTVAGYELASFVRAVVHFRNDVIITLDYALSASGAHTWDWNFHTSKAVSYSGGVFSIQDGATNAAKAYVQSQYCNSALQVPSAWTSGARSVNGQYNYTGWDGPLEVTGTVSAGTTTTLKLNGANWAANEYKGAWLKVNGREVKVTSHTADTLTFAALDSAATGTFTLCATWAPGPPASFPASKNQYHHRISTASPTTEYKAVTSVCVGANNLISGVTVTSDSQSITFTGTIQGQSRTIVFNFINKTLVVS